MIYNKQVLIYFIYKNKKLNIDIEIQDIHLSDRLLFDEIRELINLLLQMLLGCAVKCNRQHEFIDEIQKTSESNQFMLMTAIKKVLVKSLRKIVI